MPEEQQSTYRPFEPGAVKLSTADNAEKIEFPTGKIMQIHVSETGEEDFQDGEGKKVAVKFIIDSGEFKGKDFKKWFSFKASPKAGLTQVALAALGTLPAELDPSVLVGKPLQVMFQPDSYNGNTYQKATYLPPAEGQTAPVADVVPEEVELSKEEFDKILDAAEAK